MRINSNKVIGLVAVTLGVALFGLNGTSAHADILPAVGAPTVAASGTGTFLYSYGAIVTGTQQVETGDFFTIYDFAGLVQGPNTVIPANWTVTFENLSAPVISILPGGATNTTAPADSALVQNARFTYTGATTLVGAQSLGTFTLESIYNVGTTRLFWVGRGTDQPDPDLPGQVIKNANITNVRGPQAIPEPGEWAFAAFAGSSVLGLVVRARRRKTAA